MRENKRSTTLAQHGIQTAYKPYIARGFRTEIQAVVTRSLIFKRGMATVLVNLHTFNSVL